MISFIVSMDKNNVIGSNNELPWHLPKDLQFFKETTIGHTIVMGRKTFESIGRVLPERNHIILTKNEKLSFPNEVEVFHNIEDVIKLSKELGDEELFVIVGGHIFTQFLPYADRLYITLIDEEFNGDAFFPSIAPQDWKLISKVKGDKDHKNPYDYYFIQYDRVK